MTDADWEDDLNIKRMMLNQRCILEILTTETRLEQFRA